MRMPRKMEGGKVEEGETWGERGPRAPASTPWDCDQLVEIGGVGTLGHLRRRVPPPRAIDKKTRPARDPAAPWAAGRRGQRPREKNFGGCNGQRSIRDQLVQNLGVGRGL